jgi:hypothetical protein
VRTDSGKFHDGSIRRPDIRACVGHEKWLTVDESWPKQRQPEHQGQEGEVKSPFHWTARKKHIGCGDTFDQDYTLAGQNEAKKARNELVSS